MTLGLTSHLIHFDYKPRKFLSNKTSITLYVIQYTYSLERYLWVDSLCKWYYTISLPDDVSFVEGAALPVIFATAYYALHQVARIREGESVLIHSAAGGTGQAAIQIAQMAKANIFATVGSNEKRDLLIDLYGIPSDHIFCSRNGTFARGINRMLRETGGVDIALNSLSGSALVDTFECMAPYGRFLEIGKKDILDHGSLPMFPFAENVSFHAIDLSSIQEYRSEVFREIQRTITRLLCARKIRPPQPVHVYGVGDTEKAFRYLQGGMNTGKTVVELRPDDLVKSRGLRLTKKTVLDNKTAWLFESCATYVIAGGSGGIGRSVARWMVGRGARHLILLSRYGPRTQAHAEFLRELDGEHVHVETPPCDISDADSLERAMMDLGPRMPPIKGCVQSSMVLRDCPFESMTHEQWVTALKPKVQGSYNLHTLLPTGMDFFIMLSSIAGAIGSTTQANYGAGCAFQDELSHYRVSIGERSTTLNLGMMLDDGVLTENEKARTLLMSTGYLTGITQSDLYTLLDHYCNPEAPSSQLASQLLIGVDVPASLQMKSVHPPTFMRRPPLRHFYTIKHNDRTGDEVKGNFKQAEVGKLLEAATSIDEASNIICETLINKLSKALAVPRENINQSRCMHMYGVDSLVAVELRNWFAQTMDADVAIFEILGNTSFEEVSMLVAGKSRFLQNILSKKELAAKARDVENTV